MFSRRAKPPYVPLPIRRIDDVFDRSTMSGQEDRQAFLVVNASGMQKLLTTMHRTFGGTWRAEIVLRRAEDKEMAVLTYRHDPEHGKFSAS